MAKRVVDFRVLNFHITGVWGCRTADVAGIIFGGDRKEMWGKFEVELLKVLDMRNGCVLEVRDVALVGGEKFYLLFADFKVYTGTRVIEGSF
jgi:hypothetical protein